MKNTGLLDSNMRDAIALLRGWHPALSKSELISLIPKVNVKQDITSRMIQITEISKSADLEQTLKISAGIEGILTPGKNIPWKGIESLKQCITSFIGANDIPHGSMKVLSWNHGGKVLDFNHQSICEIIGGIFFERGAEIDLHAPDNIFAVVIDNETLTISCGWLVGIGSRFKGQTGNKATERPYFKPVSLDPILAKACVNIVSGPPQNDTMVLDLMCGTGGFLIEAACTGRRVLGIDSDKWMINGAKQNIVWALEKVDEIFDESRHILITGDATNPEDYISQLSGNGIHSVVFDPPYGRNSQGTIEHLQLVAKTLESLHTNANKDAQLIVFLPCEGAPVLIDREVTDEDNFAFTYASNDEVYSMIEKSGWSIRGRFFERVHRSLGRMIIHLTISPRD